MVNELNVHVDEQLDDDWLTVPEGETDTIASGNEREVTGVTQESAATLVFEPNSTLRIMGVERNPDPGFSLAFDYEDGGSEDAGGELTVVMQLENIDEVELDGIWGSEDGSYEEGYRLSKSKSDVQEEDYERNGQQFQFKNLQDYSSEITLVFEIGTRFGGGTFRHEYQAYSDGETVETGSSNWTLE